MAPYCLLYRGKHSVGDRNVLSQGNLIKKHVEQRIFYSESLNPLVKLFSMPLLAIPEAVLSFKKARSLSSVGLFLQFNRTSKVNLESLSQAF